MSLYSLVATIDGTSFLPPLGPEPAALTGNFDPNLLARLQVVLETEDAAGHLATLGTFSSSTRPGLRLLDAHELYWINVPAADYFTDPSRSYRFRALLDGREIGRSDMSSRIFEVMRYVPALPVGVKLRIEARPTPVLTAVSPSSAVAGSSLELTLSGSSFSSDSVVRFAGRDLTPRSAAAHELLVTLSEELLRSAGSYDVTVSTPEPGGGTSQGVAFTVNHAAPTLTSLAPATAFTGSAQIALTVDGAAFVEGALVYFDGAVLDTTFASPTRLVAGIPASLLQGERTAVITVENPAPAIPSAGGLPFSVIPACGNGLVDSGETCDGDCPASCTDGDACTTDILVGSAVDCNVTCSHEVIATCVSGDGCCPAGCDANTDGDCSPTCGNGVVESGETCDGDCPTSCSDGDVCTTDRLVGSAATCNATCSSQAITACQNGDGCCPSGCTNANDADCPLDHLYSFTSHTFTTCGSSGRTGPSLASCQSAYSSQPWASDRANLDMSTQGYQLWRVPATGTYRIRAAGGQGGRATGSSAANEGAIVEAEVALTMGDILTIVAGHAGPVSGSGVVAGGGGTFVSRGVVPLVIAGGGGGAYGTTWDGLGLARFGRGLMGEIHTDISGASSLAAYDYAGAGRLPPSTRGGAGTTVYAGGGGGLYATALDAYNSGGLQTGGGGIRNGGAAIGGSMGAVDGDGGFGGGGSGHPGVSRNHLGVGGGGGGGYSGGSGGSTFSISGSPVLSGSGGGSFIISSATSVGTSDGTWGTSTAFNGIRNLAAWNAGNGSVVITAIAVCQNGDGACPSGCTSASDADCPADLYSFASHTFTTCGASGRTGPSLASCQSAYSSQPWASDRANLDMRTQGYQLWRVPATGTYRIRAAGGQGGRSTGSSAANEGAIVEADVALTRGDVLTIVVGHAGAVSGSGVVAGAGGTFVSRGVVPLVIAGGGGGAYGTTWGGVGVAQFGRGLMGEIHTDISGASSLAANNYAGSGRLPPSTRGGAGTTVYAGGGGGLYATALDAYNSGGLQTGGGGVRNGGAALGGSSGSVDGDGGFGGGGGGHTGVTHNDVGRGGGGGGGYSGGSGGYTFSVSGSPVPSGSGGGSYIISSATSVGTSDGTWGTSTAFNGIRNLAAWNTGNGSVVITRR